MIRIAYNYKKNERFQEIPHFIAFKNPDCYITVL